MKKSLGAKTLIFPIPVWCVGTYDDNDPLRGPKSSAVSVAIYRPVASNVSKQAVRWI
jgi:hypothetical protein